jgi:Tol biopolymer transport system component
MTRLRHGAFGVALALAFTACVGSGDPLGMPSASGEARTPVAQPSVAASSPSVPDDPAEETSPDLYRVDPATGETTLYLDTAAALHEPERSPDGSLLVYQSEDRTGTPQIFVLDAGRSRQLTHMAGGAWEPTWSPDGSQIAFAGRLRGHEAHTKGWPPSHVAGDTDIFLMDADGGNLRSLVEIRGRARRPDWSPDGSQITFDAAGVIRVFSLEDGAITSLRQRISLNHGPAADPTWSPDGRWIAFTRFAPGAVNGVIPFAVLWLMRPDGSGERPLHPSRTPYGRYELEPTWSPDGDSIAFTTASPSSELEVVDMRTGEFRLVPTSLPASDLSWGDEGILASMGVEALPSPTTEW